MQGVRVSPGPRCSRSTSRSGGGSNGGSATQDDDRPASTSASDSEDLPPPPYLSPEVVSCRLVVEYLLPLPTMHLVADLD